MIQPIYHVHIAYHSVYIVLATDASLCSTFPSYSGDVTYETERKNYLLMATLYL